MKVFELFFEPDLDFFRFPIHKIGLGVRYLARVSSPLSCILDLPCDLLLRLKK